MINPIPQCSPDSPEWAFRAAEMINELQRRVMALEVEIAYLKHRQSEQENMQ